MTLHLYKSKVATTYESKNTRFPKLFALFKGSVLRDGAQEVLALVLMLPVSLFAFNSSPCFGSLAY